MKERPILFSAPMVCAILNGTKTQTRRIVKHEAPDEADGCQWIDFGGVHLFAWSTNGDDQEIIPGIDPFTCPHGQPSDRLWVRETFFAFGRWETRFSAKKGRDEWHFIDMTLESGKVYAYPANDHPQPHPMGGKSHRLGSLPAWWKRPAIHMPRAASRITLEISGVRVERLNEISEADAEAEGVERVVAGVGWRRYCDPDSEEVGVPPCGDARRSFRSLWKLINGDESWNANPWVWVVDFKQLKGGAA